MKTSYVIGLLKVPLFALLLSGVGSATFAAVGTCTVEALNPGGSTLVIPPHGRYDHADAAAVSQAAATIKGVPDAVNGIKLFTASTTSVAPAGTFCHITGAIYTSTGSPLPNGNNVSTINIQVVLPMTTWNGNYLQFGGNGFDGAITNNQVVFENINGVEGLWLFPNLSIGAPLQSPLARGFAISATDSGHIGGSAGFVNTDGSLNVDRWNNYGFRSKHLLAVVSKQIIKQFYGIGPDYSLHIGGSTGGRNGLVAAQRYPTDFDGILVGSPVVNFNLLPAWTSTLKLQYPSCVTAANTLGATSNPCLSSQILPTSGPLSPLGLIATATMAACDPQDGLVDGVISNPATCIFNPLTDPNLPTCSAGPAANCLTLEQKSLLKNFYSDTKVRGAGSFPGFYPGYENSRTITQIFGSNNATTGVPSTTFPSAFNLGNGFALFIFNDPTKLITNVDLQTEGHDLLDWNGSPYDPDAYIAKPDLTKFGTIGGTHGVGGKIILLAELADSLVPGQIKVDYYEDLIHETGSLNKTFKFARLYLLAGNNHTGGVAAGSPTLPLGSGYWDALLNWARTDVAPEFVGTDPAGLITRPLCAYPFKAVYTGPVGDTAAIKVASNFQCRFYDFEGFKGKVKDLPTLNKLNAGKTVKVKFSLGPNWGPNIYAAGFPQSNVIPCNVGMPEHDCDNADDNDNQGHNGSGGHNYTYVYNFVTDKSWAGTCRQLVIRLNEGTIIKANFKFKK